MQTQALTCVLRDGTSPVVARQVPQRISIYEAEHTVIPYTLTGEGGQAVSLTGRRLILTVPGLLEVDAADGEFVIESATTEGKRGGYEYDVWLLELDTLKAYQVAVLAGFVVRDAVFAVGEVP